jgi:UDP-N-acetylglucosamine 2-epimerase
MASSGMLRRVAIVGTDVSDALNSSETSVRTRASRRNIPEDTILHSHRRENLKSYKPVPFKTQFVYNRARAFCVQGHRVSVITDFSI